MEKLYQDMKALVLLYHHGKALPGHESSSAALPPWESFTRTSGHESISSNTGMKLVRTSRLTSHRSSLDVTLHRMQRFCRISLCYMLENRMVDNIPVLERFTVYNDNVWTAKWLQGKHRTLTSVSSLSSWGVWHSVWHTNDSTKLVSATADCIPY